MTIFRVPVFVDTPHYTYTCQWEGVTYRMVINFNRRSQSWYVDIADDNDFAIVQGVRLVNDFPLGRRRQDPRYVPGMFVCLSLDDDNSDAALPDLGRRVRFLYFTSDELTPPPTTSLNLTTVPSP